MLLQAIWPYIKWFLIVCFATGALMFFWNILIDTINPPEKRKRRAGEKFEDHVAKLIYKKTGYRPLRNILLDRNDPLCPNISTTEIDMILVTRKGIFVTECKRRGDHCTLTADVASPTWLVAGADEPEMSNAFNQNSMHIKVLKQYIQTNAIFNLVVVSTDFVVKLNGNIYSSQMRSGDGYFDAFTTGYKMGMVSVDPVLSVFQTGLKRFTKDLKRLPDALSEEEVKSITQQLKAYEGTKEALKRHREQFMRTQR